MDAKTAVIKVARVLVWLVYAWVTVILVLLSLTLILELFGADPTAGFVEWVYRSTERAMAPFRGIFEDIELSDQSVLDVSVMFAMIVYAFVALGLNAAINWLTRLLYVQNQREQMVAVQAAAYGPGHVVHLSSATGATAKATLTPYVGGTSVELEAAGLDPSHFYSVWLEGTGGGRVSLGTFQPSATGGARLSMTTSFLLVDSVVFGLTLLPAPGELASTDLLSARLA